MDNKQKAPKILLIDDERDFSRLLIKRLNSLQACEVKHWASGEHAIETITEFEPDILLLDINLPVLSGVQIYEQMKKLSNLNKIPVIFISASLQQKDYCLNHLKANGFLLKPFQSTQLMAKIHSILGI